MNFFSDYSFFYIYIFSSSMFCLFILCISYLLGDRSSTLKAHIQFESGIDSVKNKGLCINIKFFFIAVVFVIFDLESIFLYPWIISVRENGWFGFFEVILFSFMLILGLLYLIKNKIFD